MGATARNSSATVQGFGAILLWASLAALTTLAGPVPPFQLAALTFSAGTLVGLVYARASGDAVLPVLRRLPAGAWALGIYGLLAFHACYFFALQQAPAIEVSLIVFLWPLLVVLISGLVPARLGGRRLRWWHVLGATLAFLGTISIPLSASGRPEFSGSLSGYAAALAAAVIWATYSVATRHYRGVPSAAVTGSCAATALGSALLHLALETTAWPASGIAWLAVVGLGLGPVGLAFYLWDHGMKHGDIRLLGAVSYATPLLSTLLMAALGLGEATRVLWFAAALITIGAMLAASDALESRRVT